MKALFFDNDLAKILLLKVASKFNKFAALGKFSPVRYGRIEEPQLPNSRWLKIKNRSCGLCGTDIHFVFMDMNPATFSAATPGIKRKFLGHELLGEVVETGQDIDNFKKGDRVALRIDWPSCFQMEIYPPCPQCAQGSYMLCENLGQKELPVKNQGGGFSPFMVAHRTQPFMIPDSLSNDRALLLEPTASALHGVMKKPPQPNDNVLVIGTGTIGLLTTAMARSIEPAARIVCLARHSFQAEAAKNLGADQVVMEGKDNYGQLSEITNARHHKGYFNNEILLGGFDVVYDTVGNDRTITNALRWAKGKGSVVILGINFNPGKIDYSPIWNQEVQVFGINCHASETPEENSFDMAARILAKTKLPVEQIITHRFAMRDYRKAIKTFLNKKENKAIKIVMDHDGKKGGGFFG